MYGCVAIGPAERAKVCSEQVIGRCQTMLTSGFLFEVRMARLHMVKTYFVPQRAFCTNAKAESYAPHRKVVKALKRYNGIRLWQEHT